MPAGVSTRTSSLDRRPFDPIVPSHIRKAATKIMAETLARVLPAAARRALQ
jgi:hypothetical protein